MSNLPQTLVVISLYCNRSIEPLLQLLKQINTIKAGSPFDLVVIGNVDDPNQLKNLPQLDKQNVQYFLRENTGFNIGAWDNGWRRFPAYDYYLFLQDDCFIIRPQWLKVFIEKMSQVPTLGLLGESLNWETSWEELAKSNYNRIGKDHLLNGQPVAKIDYYRAFLAQHQIPEGKTAHHLQSIIWFTSRNILEKIDGFMIGQNYGEAIAIEIATSKKIQALGYSTQSINPWSCYHYIAHPQWFQRKRRIDRYLYSIRSRLNPIYPRL
ncbi:MAG: glycosyltransferase family 2 protein [Microcystaceae cyanobacterium]